MLNKIILVLLLTLGIINVQAQEIAINPDHPDSYVVVKGDTLWDIAGRFLQEPWRWPEIWEVNPQIENPHLIYPGDIVSLRFEGGTPVLSVDRQTVDSGASSDTSAVRPATSGRNVKLSPEVREYSRGDAIPSIPIDAIRHFLSRPLVVQDGEIEAWPYVLTGDDGRLITGKPDRVYVRGVAGEGESYSVYRKGDAYRSNGKILGYEALHVADGVVIESGDPATLLITESKREVMAGDRLVVQSQKDINADFIPHSPASRVEGSIISAFEVVSEIGRYQIVVLDRGSIHGLETGNVLGIYQSGEMVEDRVINQKVGGLNNTPLMKYLGQVKTEDERVRLPEDFAGVVMVFRTFDKLSYGLVMEAYGPVHMEDIVRNL